MPSTVIATADEKSVQTIRFSNEDGKTTSQLLAEVASNKAAHTVDASGGLVVIITAFKKEED